MGVPAGPNPLRARPRRLHVRTGRPSCRDLARSGRGAHAPSTTTDILHRRRRTAVGCSLVHSFGTACVAHANSHGIVLDPAGRDLRSWWRRWAALAEQDGARRAGSTRWADAS
ncbi:hypothetical protein [Longispora urticae]